MDKNKVYALYHNKEKVALEIKPWKFQVDESLDYNKLVFLNDCYFLSYDKKVLKQKAEEIKNIWIKEIEENLKKVTNSEIKMKY